MNTGRTYLAIALALLLPGMVAAQDAPRVVKAVRLAQPLRIDGRLDEPVYASVEPFSGFRQQEPKAGEPVGSD